ncbi:MAG: TolB family protein, partial [Actinomycetota bacterium]
MNSDPAITRITRDGKRKEDLAWSPDGKRLACSLYHQVGQIGIAVTEPDGGAFKVLTTSRVERAPSWSPDGLRLIFVHVTHSGTDGELDLHQMAVDGSERK